MLIEEDRQRLRAIARGAIEQGLHGRELALDLSAERAALRGPAATFVTLKLDGRLRGCIGVLQPCRALAEDVAHNARGAAFRDPRFSPLSRDELPRLEIHISLLGPPERIDCRDEAALVASLRPGVDGLILSEGSHTATFLPAVWEGLPDARDFVRELKLKAGLGADYWSARLCAERYVVESF